MTIILIDKLKKNPKSFFKTILMENYYTYSKIKKFESILNQLFMIFLLNGSIYFIIQKKRTNSLEVINKFIKPYIPIELLNFFNNIKDFFI